MRRVKHRRPVDLAALDRRPPVRVDSRDFEPMIARVATDQTDFGGVVHARLEPRLGRIQVTLRYGNHRLPAGWVTREAIGEEAYDEVARIHRKGGVAACPVQLIPAADGGWEVWLNPDEAPLAAAPTQALRPA